MTSATAVAPAAVISHSPTTSAAALRVAFARDGYLLMRGLLTDEALAPVRAAIDARVAEIRSELEGEGLVTSAPAAPFAQNLVPLAKHIARYGRGWTEALATTGVHDCHRAPALLDVLKALLGEQVCGHKQFNLRPKLPGQELTTVPWHQDTAYYGPQTVADTIITTWVPLVPVSAHNGCMQIVPGSHREGSIDHDSNVGEGQFLQLRATPNPDRVLTVAMEPGDVLVMHNLLWHCSLPNNSEGIRWSIDLRFYSPDTPSAKDLLWGFPQPWLLCGGPTVPASEWCDWYRKIAG